MTDNLIWEVASAKDENPEAHFSWSSCENCGDDLGGNRYDVIYRETLRGELCEAEVCESCYIKMCS